MAFKKPVDFDELYPGRFIKAGELQGKKVTLTIRSVDLDELEGDSGKKIKGIVSFEETGKALVLNKTNGICLRAMFGRKIADWEGKRVTVFPSVWNGEDCIRIWGSPDIDRDEEIVVQLPRKKPLKMVMHRVEKSNGRERAPSDPGEEMRQSGQEG